MSIVSSVVHQLVSEEHVELTLRESLLPDSSNLNELLQAVKTSFYGRTSKQYGVFQEEAGYFKELVTQWQRQDFDFVDLTRRVMEQLKKEIVEQKLEFRGHLFFAHEALEDGDYFWFFHLKHKQGLYLDDTIDIGESKQLDMAKLGFGGVIDLNALKEADSKYLTVSFGFGDRQLQSVLLDFVNFVDTINTAADTERFMEIVKAYSEHLPTEKGMQYRKKAIEYCADQDKLGETVIASDLANALSVDIDSSSVESLPQYMQATQPEAKKEFIPDRKSLKKYLRYTGKSKEVSISFSNDMLGKQVTFNSQSETLTIKNLPTALLQQLKEAVDGKES